MEIIKHIRELCGFKFVHILEILSHDDKFVYAPLIFFISVWYGNLSLRNLNDVLNAVQQCIKNILSKI